MGNFEGISHALKYIDSHLAEHISVDRLADMFYLSPFYFHRMFSAIVGKAIAEYIRDRRLEHASILMNVLKEMTPTQLWRYGFRSRNHEAVYASTLL